MHKTMTTVAVAAGFALAGAIADAATFQKPEFPRLGAISIGNPFNYHDPAYQAELARVDVAVLSNYPGFKPGGQSYETAIKAIKAKNPNILLFVYVNSNEHGKDAKVYGGGTAWDVYRNKLEASNWWLYKAGHAGTRVVSTFHKDMYIINNTPLSVKDSAGSSAMDWITKYYVDTYYKPAPSIDGLFMDNVFTQPYVDGDWNRDGKIDAKDSVDAGKWLRQGFARYYKLSAQLMPGKLQIGNIGDWGDPKATITEYQGVANGGVLEAFIGKSYSVEGYAGWQSMMDRYRKVMGAIAEPKLAIFNQWGRRTDYQAVRYGLGSTLLDDGYYSFTDDATKFHGVPWFDEYDAKLGEATTLPPKKAWQAGVFRRDYNNGIVLVNPKGNGARTVTLEGEFVKLKGTQDKLVNDGKTVRTVTLKDRDGIILMRKNPVRTPKAPPLALGD
jgi:hypothetical protein